MLASPPSGPAPASRDDPLFRQNPWSQTEPTVPQSEVARHAISQARVELQESWVKHVAFAASPLHSLLPLHAFVHAPQIHSSPLAQPGGHVERKCDSLSPSATVVLHAPTQPRAPASTIDKLSSLFIFMMILVRIASFQ